MKPMLKDFLFSISRFWQRHINFYRLGSKGDSLHCFSGFYKNTFTAIEFIFSHELDPSTFIFLRYIFFLFLLRFRIWFFILCHNWFLEKIYFIHIYDETIPRIGRFRQNDRNSYVESRSIFSKIFRKLIFFSFFFISVGLVGVLNLLAYVEKHFITKEKLKFEAFSRPASERYCLMSYLLKTNFCTTLT